jgi:hypothetical protein
MNKKQIVGIVIFIVLILGIIVYKQFGSNISNVGITTIYVATGGGKEDFISDPDIIKIMQKKYKLDVVYDNWSNGKTVKLPLVREAIGLGNKKLDPNTVTISTEGATVYDALFTSDQRFYDYYKLQPNKEAGEADRLTVLDGGLVLYTPIVLYSWKDVANKLIEQKIVTKGEDNIYYVTDMTKLINMILDGKSWKDIGLNDLFGNINIASTDPVTSSPGATYYGLLLSILSNGNINDQNINTNLDKLKVFYKKSGYMNNTPADLFERYLKTGMGGEPMIVDYEKSIIDFANANPNGFNEVKNDIRILYPAPTIWNSHCLAIFTENGKLLYKAFEDEEIQQIAWTKYGFRTGVTGGSYDVSTVDVKGIPQEITSTVSSLKMSMYEELVDYLGK